MRLIHKTCGHDIYKEPPPAGGHYFPSECHVCGMGTKITDIVWKDNPKANKYGAKKAVVDGITFASKAESERYEMLKIVEGAEDIFNLRVHPSWEIHINAKKVCKVILDFSYQALRSDGMANNFYEDVKGKDTAVSRLKRKLIKAQYGINVKIVPAKKVASTPIG